MQIINLTPHTVVLRDANDMEHRFESSGRATVDQTPGELIEISGVPVPVALPAQMADINGLPDPQDDVLFITSLVVAAHAKRADVVSPGTGPRDEPIRNADGQVVAVTRLIRHV